MHGFITAPTMNHVSETGWLKKANNLSGRKLKSLSARDKINEPSKKFSRSSRTQPLPVVYGNILLYYYILYFKIFCAISSKI